MDTHIIYGAPGCGKTQTLLRIAGEHRNESIAFVAFSNKAADEGRERIAQAYGMTEEQLTYFRTLHSTCFKAVGANRAQMLDKAKWDNFQQKTGFNFKKKEHKLLQQLLQCYRNNPELARRMLVHGQQSKDFTAFAQLVAKYKDTFKYRDFDDLVEETIKSEWQSPVDIAIVDEAQDLTPLQWRAVFSMFRGVKHLYIGGDDDQAIYEFIGSSASMFAQMKGHVDVLEKSYRLPDVICDYAKKHISSIEGRRYKDYHGNGRDGVIRLQVELDAIVIDPTKTYYMLAYTHHQLQQYIDYCMKRCLPFSVGGEPILSSLEKQQWRDGQYVMWSNMKQVYAKSLGPRVYEDPKINIGTIHSVKGGEADIVIVKPDLTPAIEQGRDIYPGGIRRVFYVAITRAREAVYVLRPATKRYWEFVYV